MSFWDVTLCYYFSLEAVFQGVAKNNPTKNQIYAENSGNNQACFSLKTHRKKNVKFTIRDCKDRFNL